MLQLWEHHSGSLKAVSGKVKEMGLRHGSIVLGASKGQQPLLTDS